SRAGAALDVARLLPEIDQRVRRRAAEERRPSDAFEVLDAVGAYLREASKEEPILVLLDDLHAADPSSLELAEFVARQATECRLLPVGRHRDGEARLSPEVDRSLARIVRSGESIALGRLDVADVGELAREERGATDEESVRMIHTATDGNPLFVRELLR